MKEFFGINITTDKKNDSFDGEGYATLTVTKEIEDAVDKSIDAIIDGVKKASIPLWATIVSYSLWAISGVLFALLIERIVERTFSGATGGHLILSIIAIVFLITGTVIYSVALLKQKRLMKSDEAVAASENFEAVSKSSKKELGVSDEAVEIDVFSYYYKIKNDESKVVIKNNYFITLIMYAFAENGKLCLCNLSERYEIPVDSISEIVRIKKLSYMDSWNKDEEPNSPRYKEFKITPDDYQYTIRDYCRMFFTLAGEEFSMIFPSYELNVIERLTGICAHDTDNKSNVKKRERY